MKTEENRQPRELILSAMQHLYDAHEELSAGTFGLESADRKEILDRLDELSNDIRDSDPIAAFLVAKTDGSEPYNTALDLWEILKPAMQFGGPVDAITVHAARAYAEACERGHADWKARAAA